MITMLTGDCRAVLPSLPDASVHCVVTSPPYWGLRDYGTATWEGGDPACDHFKLCGGTAAQNLGKSVTASAANVERSSVSFRNVCGHCGAIRIDAQLGLEPDFNAYVANMVAVFREVRRVLRDDGTLWLNMGDSYAGGGGYSPNAPSNLAGSIQSGQGGAKPGGIRPNGHLKPKDLCGIPWRVAFALQADGWYLRQDIIWSKPNPMPESVTDRCTKAHEYLFLLSKRERYYYDADAIKEAQSEGTYERFGNGRAPRQTNAKSIAAKAGEVLANASYKDATPLAIMPDGLRNKRSVWEVTTQPFSEAHFATFPPALIEPCIKAGCPRDGTVLDPFAGAGTTGLVADRLQRNAILIELNPAYAAMGERRITGDAPLFVQFAPQQAPPAPLESWAEMWAKPFDFSKEPKGNPG